MCQHKGTEVQRNNNSKCLSTVRHHNRRVNVDIVTAFLVNR